MSGIQILEKVVDSNDFTVGGGSASALAGAMGAGMVAMVARLSIDKDYGLSNKRYEEIISEADELAQKLLTGAKEDTEAFCEIKNAYSLPKETEEDKKKRSSAIQDAAVLAAKVPKQNGLMCKKVYELGKEIEGQSNTNAASDLSEAIILADAGVFGCVLNIEANLSLIKDEEIKNQFISHVKHFKEWRE